MLLDLLHLVNEDIISSQSLRQSHLSPNVSNIELGNGQLCPQQAERGSAAPSGSSAPCDCAMRCRSVAGVLGITGNDLRGSRSLLPKEGYTLSVRRADPLCGSCVIVGGAHRNRGISQSNQFSLQRGADAVNSPAAVIMRTADARELPHTTWVSLWSLAPRSSTGWSSLAAPSMNPWTSEGQGSPLGYRENMFQW